MEKEGIKDVGSEVAGLEKGGATSDPSRSDIHHDCTV